MSLASLPVPNRSGNAPAITQPSLFSVESHDGQSYYTDTPHPSGLRRRHPIVRTSLDAYEAVKPALRDVYRQILEFAAAQGAHGITIHSVAAALGKDKSAISGRLTELRRDFARLAYKLDASGARERRDGAFVLVLTDPADGREVSRD